MFCVLGAFHESRRISRHDDSPRATQHATEGRVVDEEDEDIWHTVAFGQADLILNREEDEGLCWCAPLNGPIWVA